MQPERMPPIMFYGQEEEEREGHKRSYYARFTAPDGHIKPAPLLAWLFDRDIEEAIQTDWTIFLHNILVDFMNVHREEYGKSYKNGKIKYVSQHGEVYADYGNAEIYMRAGHGNCHYICTLNSTYKRSLDELKNVYDEEAAEGEKLILDANQVRDTILNKWIGESFGSTNKIDEYVGDFFEFAHFWFAGHHLGDQLLSMIVHHYKLQKEWTEESREKHGEDVIKAIAWQKKKSQDVSEITLMINEEVPGMPVTFAPGTLSLIHI